VTYSKGKPVFNITEEFIEKAIRKLFELLLNLPNVDPVSNKIILMDTYATELGIIKRYDPNSHDVKVNQIELFCKNESTDVYFNSAKERLYERLLTLGIPKLTNMSLAELMALPTYELRMIIRAVTKCSKIESTVIDGILNKYE